MTTTIISIVLSFIFLILGGFHIYWFFGGTWGLEKVIPSKGSKAESLSIPKSATLLVALLLLTAGFLYLIKSGLIKMDIPSIVKYGYWIIPAVFTLRAIGEFNYVGFFKKVKDTEFAKADSTLFSPLCLAIGVLGFIIQFT